MRNGAAYIGVDHTNVASGAGRASVRVTSKKAHNHGLFILDLAHMPGGICGTWPALWVPHDTAELDLTNAVGSLGPVAVRRRD